MAVKVSVTNPDLTNEERTYLTNDYSTGTNLNVRNNNNFTANWYAVIGEPGQEQTETKLISAVTGNTVIQIPSSLSFSHPKSTAVYESQWNKISFERKPSAGSFAEITGSPFDIDWDNANKETLILVTNGATTDTYRWRFYNSTTGDYDDYSDSLLGSGYGRNTVGYIVEQVRRKPMAKETEPDFIIDCINDYQTNIVYPEVPKAWWFSKEGTQVATAASTYRYSIESNWSDFLSMKFMLYRYISGDVDDTYPLTWSPPAEFYNLKTDANQATDDMVKYWTILPPDSSSDKGYIGLHPTPKTTACRLKPVYFFELATVDSFADELVVPYPQGYINYCLQRILEDIKSDSNNAQKYDGLVGRSIVYLKRLARRQLGQPELFRFRGHRGWSQLFGSGGRINSQEAKELYW